jgi:hypothetical protein
LLIPGYPVSTGLTPHELKAWFRFRIAGPLWRLGGELTEYVPKSLRPRIRDRRGKP